MAKGKRLGKRILWTVAALVAVGGGVLFFTEPGRAFRDIWKTGALQDAISGPEKREYNATTESNLKAIYTALMMYHDSEGAFPPATSWMDAIQNRIGTADMDGSESQKKLISPSLAGQEGQFGYAMNDLAQGKYKDDLDPKMPLVFDSRETGRNAHGDPATLAPQPGRDGQNMAVLVDGTVQKM
jgi:hypothetical protein